MFCKKKHKILVCCQRLIHMFEKRQLFIVFNSLASKTFAVASIPDSDMHWSTIINFLIVNTILPKHDTC